jgi:hypothetical protein
MRAIIVAAALEARVITRAQVASLNGHFLGAFGPLRPK